LVKEKGFKLSKLQNLKLRLTAVSEQSVNFLISLCPNLRRLDLSFTAVRRLSFGPEIPPLEKLSLTSTQMASSDLFAVISLHPHLKILSVGALGGGQGSTPAVGNPSSMTLSDEMLSTLTDILEKFQQLENVSLVGNSKLGIFKRRESPLSDFIRRVGRRCKVDGKDFTRHSIEINDLFGRN